MGHELYPRYVMRADMGVTGSGPNTPKKPVGESLFVRVVEKIPFVRTVYSFLAELREQRDINAGKSPQSPYQGPPPAKRA